MFHVQLDEPYGAELVIHQQPVLLKRSNNPTKYLVHEKEKKRETESALYALFELDKPISKTRKGIFIM